MMPPNHPSKSVDYGVSPSPSLAMPGRVAPSLAKGAVVSDHQLDAAVLVRMPADLKARLDARIPLRKRGPLLRELTERYLDELDKDQPPMGLSA